MTISQHPVRIIGAGIGGLTLGRCLLALGIPAVVYERNPPTPRHGYGITLHASSYRPLLEILNLDEGAFRRRISVDSSVQGSGNINPKLVAHPGKVESATSFRAHRGKLERLLREGLNVQWEHSLEKIEETSSGMNLYFQNGQKLDSSCIVGVDGPHSSTRKSFSVHHSTCCRLLHLMANAG